MEKGEGEGPGTAPCPSQEEFGYPSYKALDHIYTEISRLGGRLTLIEQRLDQSENLKNLQLTSQLLDLFKRSREEYQEIRAKYNVLVQNYKKLLNEKKSREETDSTDSTKKKRRWFGAS
jgi:hypothetical protein